MTWAESDSARQRREEHERLLERVGVETDEGQRLIEQWTRENRKGRLTEAQLFRGYGVPREAK